VRAVTIIEGQMAPLPRANVDTDQIIPKQFLKRIERSGFGPFLFYDWAVDEEGEPIPEFVLNRPEYRDARVLVTGLNFGSGSSREHAPWALEDRGFEAIIAPSFADIFRNNCHKIGLVPVALEQHEVNRLMELAGDPLNAVTIDVANNQVIAEGFEAAFDLDPFAQQCLVNGLDHIALTMQHSGAIDRFEAARPAFKPSLG
jgi:3-isopropylmalate/(R)-2-methylmalate dehydratase small subunit